MDVSARQRLLVSITEKCGLPADRFRLFGEDGITMHPDPNDPYEKVDCLIANINSVKGVKLGFVGNEMYVENQQ